MSTSHTPEPAYENSYPTEKKREMETSNLHNGDHNMNTEQDPVSRHEKGMSSDTTSVDNLHREKADDPHRVYSFRDPAVAEARKEYLTIIMRIAIVTIICMWGFLPIYWASLAYSAQHVSNLRAWVIDHDGSAIGQGVLAGVQNLLQTQPKTTLGWEIMDPTDARVVDNEAVMRSIVNEEAWVALVVNAGATQSLLSARSTGNASYVPQSSITVYYAQARNELAAGNFIVPIMTGFLSQATARISANLTATWLGSASADEIKTALGAPQSVSGGVGFMFDNLRPYTASVATAVILVGQIYTAIFAFIITMANFQARMRLQAMLKMRSLILLRLIVPFIIYIPLSLNYAMVSLPFKLPFGAKYNYARGFFLYWTIALMTMTAMGFATEAMITILTVRFIAYFLLCLIISNVAVASLPTDLQAGIFRYGKGFPVYNASEAIRTVIFNTKSHLGLNLSVLLVWIIISLFTTALFTFLMEGRARRIRREGAGRGKVA